MMGKVAGSHGEVSGARGEEGTQACTCRRPGAFGWFRSARPLARAAEIRRPRAAPRPPRRRRGEPGGPRRSVCPSSPAGARRPGAAGGAGRGGAPRSAATPLVAAPLAAWLQAHSRRSGPRARRGTAGDRRLRDSGRATSGLLDGPRGGPAGRAPPPGPKCRVTPGAARRVQAGAAGARPAPPTCAPSGDECTLTLLETGDLLCGPGGPHNASPPASKALRICQNFLPKDCGPQLVLKQVRRKQPQVLPIYYQPRCLKTRAQCLQDCFTRSVSPLTKSEELADVCTERKEDESAPFSKDGRGARKEMPRNKPRTPARAACGPEGPACPSALI